MQLLTYLQADILLQAGQEEATNYAFSILETFLYNRKAVHQQRRIQHNLASSLQQLLS